MQLTPTRLAIVGYHWWGSVGTCQVKWYQLEGGVDFGGASVVRAILDTSLDNSVACGLGNSGGLTRTADASTIPFTSKLTKRLAMRSG